METTPKMIFIDGNLITHDKYESEYEKKFYYSWRSPMRFFPRLFSKYY